VSKLTLHLNAKLRLNSAGRHHESFDGKEYLVVPAVLLKEMVVNGELATAAEFGAFPEMWDGRPVVIGHPKEGGHYISANSPTILQQTGVGYLFNTTLVGNALKSELWLDTAKMRTLGGKALTALTMLEAGEPLEVSTGYYSLLLPTPGTYDGVNYVGQQLDFKPDHLALLPGEIGACSWASGCGAGRWNAQKGSKVKNRVEMFLKANRAKAMQMTGGVPALDLRANEASMNETWTALDLALGALLGDPYGYYIEDIYDGTVIYQVHPDEDSGESGLFSRSYTLDDSSLEVTLGEEQAVVRRVTYESKGETEGDGEEETTTETVEAAETVEVTANEGGEKPCGCGGDAPTVNTEPKGAIDPTFPTPKSKKPERSPVANADKKQQVQDYIAGIPDASVRQFIANGVKAQESRRAELIAGLKANERNLYTEDELKALDLDKLERLDEMLAPVDFTGRGGPRVNRSEDTDDEVLLAPGQEAPASAAN
jgi:hypothetical protein